MLVDKMVLIGLLILIPMIWCRASGERIPAGGRARAMGGTAIAATDFWSIGNNQAGLAWEKKPGGGISYENYFLLSGLASVIAGVSIPLNVGTFGFSLTRYGNSLYYELQGGLSFARKFGKKVSIGLQFDYLKAHLDGVYGAKNAVSFQLGVIYRPDNQLTLGLHLRNPYPVRITESPDEYWPASIDLGFSWKFSKVFLAAGELEKDIENLPAFRGGCEYFITSQFIARLGISGNPFTFSFGFGLELGSLTFDLSSNYQPSLGFSPSASLVYIFHR